MATEENKIMFRQWIDAWNDSKDERIGSFFADDVVMHNPMPPPEVILGLTALKQWHRAFSEGFPTNEVTIEDIIAEGDHLVARCTMRGVHAGKMGDMAPSHREVTLPYIIIARIQNGKIAEAWEHFDSYGLMRQIGVLDSAK